MDTEISSLGVDWITLTNVHKSPLDKSMLDVYKSLYCGSSDTWGTGGYKGYRCRASGIRWGQRTRKGGGVEEILIASGPSSRLLFSDGVEPERFRCTRIDLQVTWVLDQSDRDLARKIHDGIETSRQLGVPITGKREATLIRGEKGDTLYVGRRKSKRFMIRFYDKSSWYQGDSVGLYWRQEVQFGRELANGVLSKVSGIDNDKILSIVTDYILKGCYTMLFDGQEMVSAVGDIDVEASISTIESRLEWLAHSVRPVVVKLLEDGYVREVLDRLGLLDKHNDEFD